MRQLREFRRTSIRLKQIAYKTGLQTVSTAAEGRPVSTGNAATPSRVFIAIAHDELQLLRDVFTMITIVRRAEASGRSIVTN